MFPGFPSGKVRHTPVPGPFFTDLLPAIDHLAELKVSLYFFWQLDQREGTFRFLRRRDFTADPRFMHGLAPDPAEAASLLDEGLARAVERGTLLRAGIRAPGGVTEALYFLNSPKGRAAIRGLESGQWQPEDLPAVPIELAREQPNIYRLYESHIGPLTPLLADALRDAEQTYPPEWVEDAFRIAAANNVRKWKYIEAILRSWQEKGRDDQANQRNSEADRRKYVEGEFARFIKH